MARTKKRDTKFIRHITTVQQYCRYFRKESGLSLQKMEKLCNVPYANLSAWENGHSDNLEYVLIYYDVIDDLYKDIFKQIVFDCVGKDFYVETSKDIEHNTVQSISLVITGDKETEG